jgi:transposase InsO family protein
MQTVQFKKGNGVRWRSHDWKITKRHKNIIYLNSGFENRAFDLDLIQTEFTKGTLSLLPSAEIQSEKSDFQLAVDKIEHLDDDQKKTKKYRDLYCDALSFEINPYSLTVRNRVIEKISTEYIDQTPPSATTLYNWHKARDNAGNHPLAVLNKFHLRGNRKRRISDKIIKFIENKLSYYYLTNTKMSMSKAIVLMSNDFDSEFPDASFPTRKTITEILNAKYSEYEICCRRDGKVIADHKFHNTLGKIVVNEYLERVEMDGRPMDIYVVDDDCPNIILGRPIIIGLRDKFTKGVLGLDYFFDGESAEASMRVLHQAITFKSHINKRFPSIKSTWGFYGLMQLLVVDAGSGFISDGFEKFCAMLGIQLQVTKTKKPWLKGSIENLFRFVKENFESGVPGRVVKHQNNKSDIKAEDYACIRQSVFEELLYKWVCDVHGNQVSDGDGKTPNDRLFEELDRLEINGDEPYLPASVNSMKHYIGTKFKRTIAENKGIKIHNEYWNSNELQDLRRQLGTDKTLRQVNCYIDTDANNLLSIRVFDHLNNRFLDVPTVSEEKFEHIGYRLHVSIRKEARKRFNNNKAHGLQKQAIGEIHKGILEEVKAFKKRAVQSSKPRKPSRDVKRVLLQKDMEHAEKDDGMFHNDLIDAFGFNSTLNQKIHNGPAGPIPNKVPFTNPDIKTHHEVAKSFQDDFNQIDIDEGEDWDDEL